ncbi:MAG: hypothetical protein PHH11_09130 [Methylomonas sp.]|nr:hypothetical protein [Methylomonas sp.]
MGELTALQQPNAQGLFKKPKQGELPGKESDLMELFPLPQYFQTHFQYIHDNNNALRKELAQMTQQLIVMEAKLNQLLLAEKSTSNRCQTKL